MWLAGRLGSWKRLHEGMQIGEVLKAIAAQFHAHVRAVGKGRVVMLARG